MERQIASWLEKERSSRPNRVPVVNEEGVVAIVDIDEYMQGVVAERRVDIAEQVRGAAVEAFVDPSAGMVRSPTPAVLLDHAIGLQCEEDRLHRLGRG